MTRSEFVAWIQFYQRWPFDDFHRFHRPAALIASSMGGEEMQKLIDFLSPPVHVRKFCELDEQILSRFGYEVD